MLISSVRRRVLLICRSGMALTKQLPSLRFCHPTDPDRTRRRGLCFDTAPAAFSPSKALRLRLRLRLRMRSCLDHRRDAPVFKRADADGESTTIRAVPALHHHLHLLVGDSEAASQKLANGYAGCNHGSPLRFSDEAAPKKMVVAVDVDEVLGSFLSALNKFIADRYSLNHSVSEYYVYEFFKIWNCSRDEADIRVHEFFKTDYFKSGIHPIPGAWSTLHKLSPFCQLSVVTSRQNVIRDHTLEWIEKHYPGLFRDVHFGNHFALCGQSRPKSEICRSLGAQVLIDDNPRYALECAEIGMKVLLFDYDNSYPWCKNGAIDSHPLVTKVFNWREVEQHLFSWIPS